MAVFLHSILTSRTHDDAVIYLVQEWCKDRVKHNNYYAILKTSLASI